MSSCNEYAELVGHLCLETGARPRLIAPLARRLRRLATTHQKRCVVQCNGCRTCHGCGSVLPWSQGLSPYEMGTDALCDPQARPCPTCSLDDVEAALSATCEELDKLRASAPFQRIAWNDGNGPFAIYTQRDPRGATVRLWLPSLGDRDESSWLPVPTSGRA